MCQNDFSDNVPQDNVPQDCSCPSDYSRGICQYCSSMLGNSNQISSESNDVGFSTKTYVKFNNRLITLAPNQLIEDTIFIYIGHEGPTSTSMSLKYPQCPFYIINPISGLVSATNATKIVMQRNLKIEQIRDAQRIGLLVTYFDFPNFQAILDRLTSLLRKSGKKENILFCSAPDLPKLKNNPTTNIWVNVACPEATIVDRNIDPDLYKLTAAPWELELALNPNQEWKLNFESNCLELLEGGFSYVPEPNSNQPMEVSVSLITNKIQSVGINSEEIETVMPLNSKTGAVVAKTAQELQKIVDGHANGLLWGETNWYGLDPQQEAPNPLGVVVQGRKGVASGYSSEPFANNNT